jgi:AmmeMemoRadiSam system radical SAM enzyme
MSKSFKQDQNVKQKSDRVGIPGRYWHFNEDRSLMHCDLCPRECVLKDGDRGFCFVRKRDGDQMMLTTYGVSTGFCVDPIEKKPLNHFLPGTSVLSFGTAGCNLGCQFCQNWSISKSREVEILSEEATPENIAQAAYKLGCRSVAFTYNDPVIWAEYAIDTAKACHELGLKAVAVTAGYITPEARPEFYSVMDAANVDLKAFTEQFYKRLTLSALAPVLDTLKWLKHESDVWFEITNLMIPGENDSFEEIESMCDWIVTNLGEEVPVHFTAFHPDFRLQDRPPTPPETLIRAREQALKAGIKYAYIGNVFDDERENTYCPKCHARCIERNWYEIGRFDLKNGACTRCGHKIPGLFEDTPGTWGRCRLPVDISSIENVKDLSKD